MPEPSACRLCGIRFEQTGRGNMHAYCKRCTAKADRAVAKGAAKAQRASCKECGKAFSTGNPRALLCSDACRHGADRRHGRESHRRRRADPQLHIVDIARARASRAAKMNGGKRAAA